MVIPELMAYLTTASFTNLFGLEVPETPDACITLLAYPGGGAETDFGSAALKRERVRVLFLVRGVPKDVLEPATRCYALFKVLGAIQNVSIGGVLYRERTILRPPFNFGADSNKRGRHAVDVEFYKDMSAS